MLKIFSTLKKFSNWLEEILKVLLIIITGAMIIIIVYQVFGRYVLNKAPSWTEEIARFCLVWMSFLGAALIVKYKTSIRVTFFAANFFTKKTEERLNLISDYIIILFSIFMVVVGITHVMNTRMYFSEALHLPIWILNSTVPVSGVFMLFFSLADIVETHTKNRQRRQAGGNL